MKVVKNNCYGGFGLSPLAILEYAKLKGIDLFMYKRQFDYKTFKKVHNLEDIKNSTFGPDYSTKDWGETCTDEEINESYFSIFDIKRDDKALVEVVEKLGDNANGYFSNLKVVEIPDDIEWEIDDYDGLETIHEKHRSW